jgi:hypothetical protein
MQFKNGVMELSQTTQATAVNATDINHGHARNDTHTHIHARALFDSRSIIHGVI